jgi:hypothetical protein
VYKPARPLEFARGPIAMYQYPGDYLGNIKAIATVPPEELRAGTSAAVSRYDSASLVSSMSGQSSPNTRHEELLALFRTFVVQLSISSRSPMCTTMPSSDGPAEDLALSNLPWLPVDAALSTASFEINLNANRVCAGDGHRTMDLPATCMGACAAVYHSQPVFADIGPGSNLVETDASAITPGSSNSAGLQRTATPHSDSRSHEGSERENMMGEAAARKVRQKMRNRAAAARSNARRKERNDGLRQALAGATRRAVELGKTETELRAENLVLRRQLSSAQPLHRSCP